MPATSLIARITLITGKSAKAAKYVVGNLGLALTAIIVKPALCLIVILVT
jgi:hypothetical protein